MNKTFKKIAAVFSASVMCALPVVNSLSADAASTRIRTYKQTFICTELGRKYQSVKCMVLRGPKFVTPRAWNGNIPSVYMGARYFGNSTIHENSDYVWCYTHNYNGINDKGILCNIAYNTTQYTNGFACMNGDGDQNAVRGFESCLGDVTGSMKNEFDYIDVSDVVVIRRMAKNTYRSGVTTSDIQSYITSNNSFYALDWNLLCGMLAADINGDGIITDKDADIVESYIALKTGATDLEVFCGMSTNEFNAAVNRIHAK